MNFHILFLFLTVVIYLFGIIESTKCVDSGPCLACNKEELNNDYCKETGRKIKIICKNVDSEINDYRACLVTAEDDQMRVVIFQVLMGLIGGFAFWGVQTRKKMHMTQFDYRKHRVMNKGNI